MTTAVVVKAMHGWPIDVTQINSENASKQPPIRVPAGAEQTFYIHSTADLLIHEVQPSEIAAEAQPSA